jgi:hypothetical protein
MKRNIKKGVLAECATTVVAYFQEAAVLTADQLIFLMSTHLRKRASSHVQLVWISLLGWEGVLWKERNRETDFI